jgi:hypothetical protein
LDRSRVTAYPWAATLQNAEDLEAPSVLVPFSLALFRDVTCPSYKVAAVAIGISVSPPVTILEELGSFWCGHPSVSDAIFGANLREFDVAKIDRSVSSTTRRRSYFGR